MVGQFVDVQIEGRSGIDYYVLPRRALRPGDEVWTVEPDDRVRIVPVDVLQETDDRVYVAGALNDGLPVIVAGVELATDGMAVRPRERSGGSGPAPTAMDTPGGAPATPGGAP